MREILKAQRYLKMIKRNVNENNLLSLNVSTHGHIFALVCVCVYVYMYLNLNLFSSISSLSSWSSDAVKTDRTDTTDDTAKNVSSFDSIVNCFDEQGFNEINGALLSTSIWNISSVYEYLIEPHSSEEQSANAS